MREIGYEVVWPRGRKAAGAVHFAKRLDTLEGKTICEVWDRVFRGDEIFPVIEKELAKRYPGVRFVNHAEFGYPYGGGEASVIASLPDKLRQNKCDAVISGVGC